MIIGSFGDVVFSVSKQKILTFDDFKRQRSASYNEIARIGEKPTLQFGGVELEKVLFTVYLSSFLGVNIKDERKRFQEILESGKEQPLMIGSNLIGSFILESIDESWEIIDNKGELQSAGISLSLKEYVR